MKAKVCVVEVEMVKTAEEVLKDWEFFADYGTGFAEAFMVSASGGIFAMFNGEMDFLPFHELKDILTSEFNNSDLRYTHIEYLGHKEYLCRFHKNVKNSNILVDIPLS